MQNETSEEKIVIVELQKLLNQAANLASKPDTPAGYVDMSVRRARHNLKLIYGRESSEVKLIPIFDKITERENVKHSLTVRAKIIE